MSSSVELCPHGQIEGTIPIRECSDPKRVRGRVWRNRIGDEIGCLKCDQVYVWSLRPADQPALTQEQR